MVVPEWVTSPAVVATLGSSIGNKPESDVPAGQAPAMGLLGTGSAEPVVDQGTAPSRAGVEPTGAPSLENLAEASSANSANSGAVAMGKCHVLLELGHTLLADCGAFFDPVILAQLDAALAHEFANREQRQVDAATEEMTAALQEGRSTEALAYLAQRVTTAKSVATKAATQAALATDVVRALGGEVSEAGYDPEAVQAVSGAVLDDVIGNVERAKNALTAAQAHAQTIFVAQQRLSQARAGTPKEKVGRGIPHQLALARHESPFRGRQLCELSEVLVREMPCTMLTFSRGRISEYKAGIVARETVFLSLEHRQLVDQKICGDMDAVELLGNKELAAAARKAAYALEPEAFVKRQEKAERERYVSLRPAADGMTFLTALIPLKQGVRVLATLTKVADSLRNSGDERGKGQIMADALMHRLIQHAPCDEGAGTVSDHRGAPASGSAAATAPQRGAAGDQPCTTVDAASISLELVMTDRSLFGTDNEPAVLLGYDPIPAPIARDMVLSGGFSARVWLKRLFTHPQTNQLLAMESKGRLFSEGMKEFLRLQDQRCQTPYCDAPIREYDHIKAYAAGGTTSLDNGQGLCSDCNRAKESLGWVSTRTNGSEFPGMAEDGPPVTRISTPTGHRYISTAPPLPGYQSRHGVDRR